MSEGIFTASNGVVAVYSINEENLALFRKLGKYNIRRTDSRSFNRCCLAYELEFSDNKANIIVQLSDSINTKVKVNNYYLPGGYYNCKIIIGDIDDIATLSVHECKETAETEFPNRLYNAFLDFINSV